MEKDTRVQYWMESAEDDWKVAGHLFEKGDYPYSLFFAHLTIEKLLKAIYTDRLNSTPPYTHRLVQIAEKIPLNVPDDQWELLEIVTDFNLEARYPDEKFSFRNKCTKSFTEGNLRKIEEFRSWLLKQIHK
jgi:HEPN domain-containing protein